MEKDETKKADLGKRKFRRLRLPANELLARSLTLITGGKNSSNPPDNIVLQTDKEFQETFDALWSESMGLLTNQDVSSVRTKL